MSTHFIALPPVRFADLFDGRLDRLGVTERVSEVTTDDWRCLTDGNGNLWISVNKNGSASFKLTAQGGAPGYILSTVEKVFDTEIVSEYEAKYWGFESHEEWKRWEAKRYEEEDGRLYENMLKYVRGARNGIEPGTCEQEWAEKAKALIADNPELALPENQAQLRGAARTWDNEIKVELDEEDVAAAMQCLTGRRGGKTERGF